MKGKYVSWMLVALILPCLWAVAQLTSEGDEKSHLLALETAWNHAEETKDVAALDLLLHPTLVYVDYDGTIMTKAEFLASAKALELHPAQIINDSQGANVWATQRLLLAFTMKKAFKRQTVSAARTLYRYVDKTKRHLAVSFSAKKR